MDKLNKVVQALQVLQEEGREDLLWEGVLEQPWVGLRRPKRVSSECVAAAVMACSQPSQPPKMFKQKSAAGRQVRILPDRATSEVHDTILGLPVVQEQASRGGMRLTRRAGALFRQRVGSRGQGAADRSAVSGVGRERAREEGAHARLDARSLRRMKKQALLPLESNDERGERALEQRSLGGPSKMAALCIGDSEVIIVISDEEKRQDEQMVLDSSSCGPVLHLASGADRLRQFIPRIVSPMLRKVQEWEVENQNIFKAGEQVEFIDSSGLVMRGTICGEASGNGAAGMAQDEAEEIHWGQRRAVQKGTARVVAREADKKAVQSDRRVGTDRQMSVVGNLPRERLRAPRRLNKFSERRRVAMATSSQRVPLGRLAVFPELAVSVRSSRGSRGHR
ncbi:hypothetical protein NDU88_002217 [Pleurodeles waltl]|uniref:Uncharacterized protein n=1 Tax=Pleurodeles waltl TaxID=8319 RepID=A0AAV7T1S7_PLEWA|nr:hypothetical protein NDU88_002217 [Pleurodeles waltl]